MLFHFKTQFPELNVFWDKYLEFQTRLEIPAKTVLLEEGKISQQYIFIEKGCVRTFFNNNGNDKTVQFFFENEGLASLESFVNNIPSQFTIETIESSVVYLLPKQYVTQLLHELSQVPDFMQLLLQIFSRRLTHYTKELVSFIRDTPEERYQNLLSERPHIVQRVPQHYIASYLGVSTVHLSRIKSKLAKGKPHF
ncbi:cyclic nucleotide-binding domain-containing protein [Chitinophaga oryziterrae]|uniref:Cyclic nucleotide-binding domain-containing protein n=1 Tax=Chitinophaga oryziterrae TaxID=1031224 RepID=A0A6N8J5C5_9BACT|nr:Crp/Fnr family transcriptional regulator [Chitinophaga oryziterrae]MVT39871.1 cyclic nucleotide-binding domain-containing protein [Chitinophaga oryziterrae]